MSNRERGKAEFFLLLFGITFVAGGLGIMLGWEVALAAWLIAAGLFLIAGAIICETER